MNYTKMCHLLPTERDAPYDVVDYAMGMWEENCYYYYLGVYKRVPITVLPQIGYLVSHDEFAIAVKNGGKHWGAEMTCGACGESFIGGWIPIENNNVDELSVKQLKELTDKLTAAEEQITFFKEEVEILKEENENEAIKADDRAEMLEGEIKRLRDELKAEKEKPAAVVAKEPSPDELKKLTAAAVKEATDKLKKKHEDEIQKAKNFTKAETEKSVREELAAEYQKKISAIESEKNSALERLSKMESDSKIAASPELIEFRFYFNEIQKYAQKLNGIIASAPPETKENLTNALKALAQLFGGKQNEN